MVRTFTASALACLVLIGLASAAESPLTGVPDSATISHPGADAAPASSPTTYPDAGGFALRAKVVLEGVANGGLGKWRRGYFTGGDPGKYLPGHAMAKLLLGRDEDEVRKYMNDDRSFKEHYHFAAVNWGRFYPLFGETVLTEDTRKKFADKAHAYSAYLTPGGTENHKTMWMTTANVLPVTTGRGLARRGKDDTLKRAKRMLRDYVKGLYAAGQGEWDSSTYLPFDVNGMLNIYDFAEDPQVRLLAKAALDWYIAGYALKYRDGVYTAPNQRGFAKGAHAALMDHTGYVWFGSAAEVTPEDTRGWRYTIHPITSGYRPSRVLVNLATKNLPGLPATFRNTKPNYWYGLGKEPKAAQYAETVHLGRGFTLAGLWNGSGGQITRWQLAAATDTGGVVLTGGHPRKSDHRGKKTGLGFTDGKGYYDRSVQVGGTLINMTSAPEDEPVDWSFVTLPEAARDLQTVGPWQVFRLGKTFVGVRPITGTAEVAEVAFRKDKRDKQRVIKLPGRRNGFILEAADAKTHGSLAAFAGALRATKLAADGFAESLKGTYTNVAGKRIEFGYAKERRFAEADVDGKAIEPENWNWVYRGPFVKQEGGVLTVSDGRRGFVVDFSGEMPVYRAWKE